MDRDPVARLFADRLPHVSPDRQHVGPIAPRHERALERVAVHSPAYLHQTARGEVLDRLAPRDVGPSALVRALLQRRREAPVDPALTARTSRFHRHRPFPACPARAACPLRPVPFLPAPPAPAAPAALPAL